MGVSVIGAGWAVRSLPEVFLYDTAERREQLAASLQGVADEEAIEARVVADTNFAQPASEAVTNGPQRAPTARQSRGRGAQTRGPARRDARGR